MRKGNEGGFPHPYNNFRWSIETSRRLTFWAFHYDEGLHVRFIQYRFAEVKAIHAAAKQAQKEAAH